MIYLQWCCFCVDLRIGTFIVAISDVLMDLLFGIFIFIFGESGEPDLCHKLFCIFMLTHLISAVFLFLGALWLRPNCMLMYIMLTLVKILAMIILVISDVILVIWAPVIALYVIMFVLGIYYWLVAYSFYAALGGDLFI
ncbi:uncharacterized protein LOC132791130 [Drosophila nasuta]|uniref:Uncharacterized protein LOC117567221 n=1 Tax=Drosophila albomicans TaxID=7291 RepID=A0A6P8WGZ0_DROAB|nr:uncharacterized protein LOC117567221 [Drosophila albomicans]XP_060655920.1 uncharacterized protein LOC132791130 [Drosophila nasuta]